MESDGHMNMMGMSDNLKLSPTAVTIDKGAKLSPTVVYTSGGVCAILIYVASGKSREPVGVPWIRDVQRWKACPLHLMCGALHLVTQCAGSTSFESLHFSGCTPVAPVAMHFARPWGPVTLSEGWRCKDPIEWKRVPVRPTVRFFSRKIPSRNASWCQLASALQVNSRAVLKLRSPLKAARSLFCRWQVILGNNVFTISQRADRPGSTVITTSIGTEQRQ